LSGLASAAQDLVRSIARRDAGGAQPSPVAMLATVLSLLPDADIHAWARRREIDPSSGRAGQVAEILESVAATHPDSITSVLVGLSDVEVRNWATAIGMPSVPHDRLELVQAIESDPLGTAPYVVAYRSVSAAGDAMVASTAEATEASS
jgi:hypothetical protein